MSASCLQRIAEHTAALGTGIQTHANESFYEKHNGPRAFGTSTMEYRPALGVLGPRFSIAHGTTEVNNV